MLHYKPSHKDYSRILFLIIQSSIAVPSLFAATIEIGMPSVVLHAGETVEVPVNSSEPISGDLTAKGKFKKEDVSFTPDPKCHLSRHDCSLRITASLTSRDYSRVPVVVSESNATNKPVFFLTVIPSAEAPLSPTNLPKTAPKISNPSESNINPPPSLLSTSQKPINFLSSGNLSATIIPHSISSSDYTISSNGPVYQMIAVTNTGGTSVTLELPVIDGDDPSSFSIDTNSADYGGTPFFCYNTPTLAPNQACKIIIKSTLENPALLPKTAKLTISDGVSSDTLEFTLTDTTYVYAGGGFNTLGNASSGYSEGALLAKCTNGTCSNALGGSSNNYASSNNSVGAWINAMAVTPTGNIIVGGAFGAIGGATSGASGPQAALLAQCIPSDITGNTCFNQLSGSTPYAFNNGYIDAITAPVSIGSSSYIILRGDFKQIKGITGTGGVLLARCQYAGVTSQASCANYLGSKVANNAIAALDTLGSTPGSPLINTGGLFTQIAGYPTSPPSTGTTFARCATGSSGPCSQGVDGNNPNSSILGMTDNGSDALYMGGTFTQIGAYTDTTGGYPLVQCTISDTLPTACTNALSGSNDANGYIEGLAYSGNNLYVGGSFTTIGGATPVSSGNMLAICTPNSTCSNFITDTNPYATGRFWKGGIFAIAVGNQTTITPTA